MDYCLPLQMNTFGPKKFELHAWVKKCHFGNFSEKAGMAMPCQCGPQKCIIGFEKFFLFWVPMNIQKDWEAKLESAYFFMLKYSKITVCNATLNRGRPHYEAHSIYGHRNGIFLDKPMDSSPSLQQFKRNMLLSNV